MNQSVRSAEPQGGTAAQPPAVKTLNTPREFPKIDSRKEWQARAKEIREHVLVSCGLWPMPEKTPVMANVFGKVERDGYSIEKVYIETLPGFYLGGNLYRPLGRGKGPFPAILNPHGHWKEGRLGDTKDGSTSGRCISFARQGMIAFCYDMVGYNDTVFGDYSGATPQNHYQRHHSFATGKDNLLWNISLMGLQTWNSIRALDFIASLPDADTRRLACTGESGGGTQTFMLGSVEDRLAAQAPIVMVSHTMQGGCQCENAPGLRVEYSNMEIAAAAATRPQILVAATGDWTKDTPTVEGPAIENIYQLFNAGDKFHYVRFDFGHNYNQTSREAVYAWFGKWLLKNNNPDSLKEPPFKKEADADLWVFPDGKLPDGAATEAQIIESLKNRHRAQWDSLVVRSRGDFQKFKRVIEPAWRHTLPDLSAPHSGAMPGGECAGIRRVHGCRAQDQPIRGRPGHPGQLLGPIWGPRQEGDQGCGPLQWRHCFGAAGCRGKACEPAIVVAPARPGGASSGPLQHRHPNQPIRQFLFDLQPHRTPGARARPPDGLRRGWLGG